MGFLQIPKVRPCLIGPRCTFGVQRARSVPQLIADGNYDFVESTISGFTNCKPEIDQQRVAVQFFRANGILHSIDVCEELFRRRYRPINIFELLSLGIAYPHLQRRFCIVALGTVVVDPESGVQVCAGLTSDCVSPWLFPGRDLASFCFDFPWHGKHRFAAVRKD